MTGLSRIISLAMCLAPAVPAGAMNLDFPPNARKVAEQADEFTSYALPISPWSKGELPTIWAEGALDRQAWRVDGENLNTMRLLQPLRDQLAAEGFDILFECKANDCGGFDFRFGTEVMPEPEMHVDLGDFRFLSAQRMGAERPEYVSLLVSRSRDAGFIQLTTIGSPASVSIEPVKSTKASVTDKIDFGSDLATELETAGSVVLTDLTFKTGSSSLEDGDYRSLGELATYLKANPDRTVLLVGHTDAEGGLSGNVALSRKRAKAVARKLTRDLEVPKAQVSSEGVGFLSPRASNLTEDGRTQNRRVEVILTSTE